MDHSKNSDHNGTSCNSNKRGDAYNCTLNTCLRLLEARKDMLEKNVGKYSQLKSEVNDLHIELENVQTMNADTKNGYNQSFIDVNQDWEAKSLKNNEIINKLYELEQIKQQLQHNIQSNTVQEMQMVEKIQKLKYDYEEFIENNNKYQYKILNEKESAKMLKRKLYDLENVISCKTVEANKLRCVLNETETELQLNRKKLITIQQENSTTDQAVNVLTTKYQAREAELVTMRKVAPERLVQAEQCVDAVCQELATVNAKVAEWKCKAEQSIKMLSELKASSDLELGYDRTLLGELICERHRLVEQQLDKSNQLEKILACNCRLVADSKTVAERKASLSAEVECLEQSKCCDRLALILYQTTSDSEAVLHDDEMAIKFHTLTSVANEVEPLRRACQDRESAISDAKRHLDECCSVRVKVCGGSAK